MQKITKFALSLVMVFVALAVNAQSGWDGKTVTTSMDNGVVTKIEDLNNLVVTLPGAKSIEALSVFDMSYMALENVNGSEMYGVWSPVYGGTYTVDGDKITLSGFNAMDGITVPIPAGTTKLYIEDYGTFKVDGGEETYIPTIELAANIAAAAQPFMFTSISNNGVEGNVIQAVEAAENGVMYQFEVLASGKALSKGTATPTLSLLEDATVNFGEANIIAYEAETAYVRFMTLQQQFFTQPGTYVLSIPEGTFVDAEGTPNAAVTVKWVIIEKARSFVIENVEVGTVTDTSWGFNDVYYTATVKFQKPVGAKYAYSEGLHMDLNGENTGVPFTFGQYGFIDLDDVTDENGVVTLVYKDNMQAKTDDPAYEGDLRPAGSYVGTTVITFMNEDQWEIEGVSGTYTGSIVLPELLTLGEPVWNLEMNEDGTANLEEDMVNIGVPVSFPNIELPSDVNPMELTATISASLYGVPSHDGDIMPISGEGEVGDENGVNGPVAIVEAQLHNAYIDGTGLHANLFPEMLELGNHYGIVINAVTVMNGETVVVELDKEALSSPEIIVVPAKPSLGDIEWGLDNIDYEAKTAELQEDMAKLGVPVSFPNIVIPGDVNPMNLSATISASLYGVSSHDGDIMPISGEGEVGDENGVNGPTPIVEAQLHDAYIDANGLHANLFPEMLELGNHYGIVINAVTVMDGEEVLFMYEGEPFNSPEIVVVPVKPSLGEMEWGLDNIDYEENTAELSEDMVNIGVPVSFPNIILPSDVNPMNLSATVSASLYGISSHDGDIMPISGEGELGDENGVEGPTPIVEALIHNAVIDATGLHANLFAEMLEVGNHYGIVINAVTVMDGEEVILEYEGEGINSPEIVVVPAVVAPSFGGVAFNIEEGAEINVDDVHNLAIKMYFPDGTGFEGYAFHGDAMLQKLVEGEWVMVEEGSKVGFTELYSEFAEEMLDAEFAPALFADLLQDAVVGETYRVLAIDFALIDAEGEPVIFESYEDPTTAPYVTFTVVDVTDGISTIKFNTSDVKYNLSGQRVNNAKGIVIMNGKKFINK